MQYSNSSNRIYISLCVLKSAWKSSWFSGRRLSIYMRGFGIHHDQVLHAHQGTTTSRTSCVCSVDKQLHEWKIDNLYPYVDCKWKFDVPCHKALSLGSNQSHWLPVTKTSIGAPSIFKAKKSYGPQETQCMQCESLMFMVVIERCLQEEGEGIFYPLLFLLWLTWVITVARLPCKVWAKTSCYCECIFSYLW